MGLPLEGRRILLGVAGSIAAYKAPEILRRLQDQGARVTCVLTREACSFIGPLTFQALSREPVWTHLLPPDPQTPLAHPFPHLHLAREVDLVLVAPATAQSLARASLGLADDLLGCVLLATRAPVMMAPALDVGMGEHPAYQEHVQRLQERGVEFVGPEEGPLASGWVGPGRLARVEAIVEAVCRRLHPRPDFRGRRVVVTAGPTREPLDPVRFLGNRSSGQMGYALARIAWRRGAQVHLISGPTGLEPPPGVSVEWVETARDMGEALDRALEGVDVLLMAAAVADFTPKMTSREKIRRGPELHLHLTPTEDLLARCARRRRQQQARGGKGFLVVGFAAEDRDLAAAAQQKLQGKDLDLVVANPIGEPGVGMEASQNRVLILDRKGHQWVYPPLDKEVVAERILDHVADLLASP